MDKVRNPMCTEYPKPDSCFADNRATLHLHGGTSPWISDGTAHQWITPAGETTPWPQGVSVESVPDMNVCQANNDGCMTFYYTNQQSARLLFYHDHAWGITRLNVYAGEAAGYLITDPTEQKLFGAGAPYEALGKASRWSSRTAPSSPTPPSWLRRTPPGTSPAGAPWAASGTTTSTCPPRTPATRAG